jgi:hypothetical protein
MSSRRVLCEPLVGQVKAYATLVTFRVRALNRIIITMHGSIWPWSSITRSSWPVPLSAG